MPGDLTIEVVSIEGPCPVCRVGDRFEIVGGYLDADARRFSQMSLYRICEDQRESASDGSSV